MLSGTFTSSSVSSVRKFSRSAGVGKCLPFNQPWAVAGATPASFAAARIDSALRTRASFSRRTSSARPTSSEFNLRPTSLFVLARYLTGRSCLPYLTPPAETQSPPDGESCGEACLSKYLAWARHATCGHADPTPAVSRVLTAA